MEGRFIHAIFCNTEITFLPSAVIDLLAPLPSQDKGCCLFEYSFIDFKLFHFHNYLDSSAVALFSADSGQIKYSCLIFLMVLFLKVARPGFSLTIPILFEHEIQRCLNRNRKSS